MAKHSLLLYSLLTFFVFSANTCKKKDLEAILDKTWYHSAEEEEVNSDIRIYRPETYNFPLSRGREGFEIKKDGSYTRLAIAPTDGIDRIGGTWKAKGNILEISLRGNRWSNPITYRVEFIEYNEKIIKVKALSN